jgi:hypothetical protein
MIVDLSFGIAYCPGSHFLHKGLYCEVRGVDFMNYFAMVSLHFLFRRVFSFYHLTKFYGDL